MFKTSVILSCLSVWLGLAGVANQVVMAKVFGAGVEFDTYLLAISIPLLAMGSANVIISHCFLPVLVREKCNCGTYRAVNSAFLLAGAGFALLWSVLAWHATPLLMRSLAGHLPLSFQSHAAQISRISWATFGCMLVCSCLTALHHCAKSFLAPIAVSFGPCLGMIAASLAGPREWGTALLVWGMFAGAVLGLPILFAGVAQDVALRWPARDAFRLIARAGSKLPLVLLASLGFAVFGTVDAIVAAPLGAGALSYLGYSQRILIALGNVIILGPANVLIPYLSEALAAGDAGRASKYTWESLLMVILLSAPVALTVFILRLPLLEMALQRGAFNASMTSGVAATLPWMLLGMVAMLGCVIVFKILYARQDFRTPALLGGAIAVLYLSLSFAFSRIWGLDGICFGYALTWWLTLGVAIKYLRRGRTSPAGGRIWLGYALRYSVSLFLTALLLWGLRLLLISPLKAAGPLVLALRLAVTTLIAGVAFAWASTTLLRIPELNLFFGHLTALFRKNAPTQA